MLVELPIIWAAYLVSPCSSKSTGPLAKWILDRAERVLGIPAPAGLSGTSGVEPIPRRPWPATISPSPPHYGSPCPSASACGCHPTQFPWSRRSSWFWDPCPGGECVCPLMDRLGAAPRSEGARAELCPASCTGNT